MIIPVPIINKSGFDLPLYETPNSAGFDIRAVISQGDIYLEPHKSATVNTGLYVVIPMGYELQIRGRSGIAMKYFTQGVETVDSDYRGEIKIFLTNHGDRAFVINHGDRIAQGIIAPILQAEWIVVNELDKTIRADGGFGHTGV